jgi:hypothetical protein
MSDDIITQEFVNPLLPLAERIAKREPIDWDSQAESADDSTRRQIVALMEIAAIEAAHRKADETLDGLEGEPLADAPVDAPEMWRHLTLLDKIGEGNSERSTGRSTTRCRSTWLSSCRIRVPPWLPTGLQRCTRRKCWRASSTRTSSGSTEPRRHKGGPESGWTSSRGALSRTCCLRSASAPPRR